MADCCPIRCCCCCCWRRIAANEADVSTGVLMDGFSGDRGAHWPGSEACSQTSRYSSATTLPAVNVSLSATSSAYNDVAMSQCRRVAEIRTLQRPRRRTGGPILFHHSDGSNHRERPPLASGTRYRTNPRARISPASRSPSLWHHADLLGMWNGVDNWRLNKWPTAGSRQI